MCSFSASFFHSWPGRITPKWRKNDSQPLDFRARKNPPKYWVTKNLAASVDFGGFPCRVSNLFWAKRLHMWKTPISWAVCAFVFSSGWEWKNSGETLHFSSSSNMIQKLGRDVGFWSVSVDVSNIVSNDTFSKETMGWLSRASSMHFLWLMSFLNLLQLGEAGEISFR